MALSPGFTVPPELAHKFRQAATEHPHWQLNPEEGITDLHTLGLTFAHMRTGLLDVVSFALDHVADDPNAGINGSRFGLYQGAAIGTVALAMKKRGVEMATVEPYVVQNDELAQAIQGMVWHLIESHQLIEGALTNGISEPV